MIALYEGQLKSAERDAKTQYLLVGILAALGGSKLVGSPPLVIISFLALLASATFALLVLARSWKASGPVKYVMGTLLVTSTAALATNLGLDGTLTTVLSILRIALAVTIAYWAATIPLVKREQIIVQD